VRRIVTGRRFALSVGILRIFVSRTLIATLFVMLAAGALSAFSPTRADSPQRTEGTPNPAPAIPPPGTFPTHHPPTDEELDRLVKSGFASEVKVDRVLVPAIVLDRKGRPVQGLKAESFTLAEDLVPQKIDYFQADHEEQISIAFLLDVSGSMRLLDKMGQAREAVAYFLDSLKPSDEAQLMTFADGEVETVAPFGTKPRLVRAFLYSLKAYGQTALNDAIAAAPEIVQTEKTQRRAIILITDGVDNFSKLSLHEAVSSARRTSVPIFAIGFAAESLAVRPDTAEAAGTNEEILRRVAEETGGAFFLIHDPDELKEAIRSIEEDLRSEYVLGYTPPSVRCDGSYRSIQLKVAKDRYQIRTRRGYFSGPC